jgi:3-methylfumaryl-CoA hydratase
MDIDIHYLREWIGRAETRSDQITPAAIAALSATLDREDPYPRDGEPLPPLWHWLYFLPATRQSELGPDGHAKRGGFLPPVPLPRRMFAGGRYRFQHDLQVGEQITRVSKVSDVSHKMGRSGPLVFVVVRHEISNKRGLALVEEHDIVYREEARSQDTPTKVQLAPEGSMWTREIHPDPVLLFRYSALTFNGHRIHYDQRFCTEVEGYPGLVVHGPLIATLLLDLLRRNRKDVKVERFSFRAVRPLFDETPFWVCGRSESDGKTIQLWARDSDNRLAMDATANLG